MREERTVIFMSSRYDRERQEHQPHPGPSRPSWDATRYRLELFRTSFNPGEPYFAYTVRMPDGGAVHFAFDVGVWKWKVPSPGACWAEVYNPNGTPDAWLLVRS